jgi:2',3'-cyclic-nucleotide 2'-phosphodiesterase (5'-nucleotidase family)
MVFAGFANSQSPVASDVSACQSIADVLRSTSGSDFAFFPSGYLLGTKQPKNLALAVEHPEDELWIVNLTGKQIKSALERSVAFYPQPCACFLYFSGMTVSVNTTKSERVESITPENGVWDFNKSYKVAMPASLARGGLGFFTVWEFQKPDKTISSNLTKLLESKTVQYSVLRWQFKASS